MRATPYARATSGGSAVPADEAERERAIRADWISADGGFANDAFIKSLLSSAAPKLLHEQLRKRLPARWLGSLEVRLQEWLIKRTEQLLSDPWLYRDENLDELRELVLVAWQEFSLRPVAELCPIARHQRARLDHHSRCRLHLRVGHRNRRSGHRRNLHRERVSGREAGRDGGFYSMAAGEPNLDEPSG